MLFDRVYRLLVGKKGQDKSGLEITELRIQFDIEKSAKKNPNKSTIKVWNMQRSTRAELEKPDTRCLLYAGYAEEDGPILIFSGGVTYVWSKVDGPDIITEFDLGDGAQEIRDTTISVGYAKNVRSSTVLNDVSKQMGLPLTIPSDIKDRIWENGLSYYGSARVLMDKVTKANDTEWSIQNGTLQVIRTGGVTTRQGIVLSGTSGLIGSPERMRQSKHGTKKKSAEVKKQYDGWKCKTLLMPYLNPGDRIKLESRMVEGIFRVQSIKHEGDSHDGDWQTEMKVIDPNAPLAGGKSKGGLPGASEGDFGGGDEEFDE